MTSRRRILCISLSLIARDARVLRQIGVLAEHGDVTTVGFGPAPTGVAEHLELPSSLTLPQTPLGVAHLAIGRVLRGHLSASEVAAPAVQAAIAAVGDRPFDLVVANEARSLGLAFAVNRGAPVWADLHEWAPGERTQILRWRLLVAPLMDHLCARYLPQCAATTTVSEGIVAEYERVYGVRPELVRNSQPFADLTPSPMRPDGTMRLVHSGAAIAGRRLESLIESATSLDRVTLDLYLVPAGDGGRYLARLRDLTADLPTVTLHDPVPPEALPRTLNDYDVGVFPLSPDNLNMKHVLPNKVFDYVQARLALAVTPNPQMRQLVLDHGIGVVSTDYSTESFTAVLAGLTPTSVAEFKQAAHRQARALSNEQDLDVSHAIVDRLLGG